MGLCFGRGHHKLLLNDEKDEISDSDKLDDANKLNEGFKSENGRVDVDPVARLNDWIQEVDQKQKDLKTRSTVARKAETGMDRSKLIMTRFRIEILDFGISIGNTIHVSITQHYHIIVLRETT